MADDPKTPAPQVRLVKSSDFRNVYFNTFRIRVGGPDVSSTLGFQSQTPNGQPLITDEVEIIMTSAVLKFFAESLLAHVRAIEKEIGEIQLPADIKEHLLKLPAELEDRIKLA